MAAATLPQLGGGLAWVGESSIVAIASLGAQLDYEYCFAAGTRVLLADGSSKPIEEMQPGDLVLAAPDTDPLGGARAPPRGADLPQRPGSDPHVAHRRRHRADNVQPPVLRAWPRLGVGKRLANRRRIAHRRGAWTAISDVFVNGEVEPVYNVQVEDRRTYFVMLPESGAAVLVHNASFQDVGNDLQKGNYGQAIQDVFSLGQPAQPTASNTSSQPSSASAPDSVQAASNLQQVSNYSLGGWSQQAGNSGGAAPDMAQVVAQIRRARRIWCKRARTH